MCPWMCLWMFVWMWLFGGGYVVAWCLRSSIMFVESNGRAPPAGPYPCITSLKVEGAEIVPPIAVVRTRSLPCVWHGGGCKVAMAACGSSNVQQGRA